MKKISLLVILLCSTAYSFYDAELERVWNSVSDINNPTLEDYRSFENYLSTARRSYLDYFLPEAQKGNAKFIRFFEFKFVGDLGEQPIFERHVFNVDEENKDRCILLYASYNGIYPSKVRKILSEIEQSGYRGHVLVRIGGFPNTTHGDLKICHVPYAFKVAFFREAQRLGYKNILWNDSAMHPLTDYAFVFKTMDERGYFFTTIGTLKRNASLHNLQAARSLGIDEEHYDKIFHISSGIFGLNMEKIEAQELLYNWHQETQRVFPCITLYPEELALSVLAWRLHWVPYYWFFHFVCEEKEFYNLNVKLSELINDRHLNFFLDFQR
jgi:hypothetical protein